MKFFNRIHAVSTEKSRPSNGSEESIHSKAEREKSAAKGKGMPSSIRRERETSAMARPLSAVCNLQGMDGVHYLSPDQ